MLLTALYSIAGVDKYIVGMAMFCRVDFILLVWEAGSHTAMMNIAESRNREVSNNFFRIRKGLFIHLKKTGLHLTRVILPFCY